MPELQMLVVILSFAFSFLGAADLCLTIYDLNPFKHLRRFKEDTRGIAWIWIVAGITLCFTPFVYWGMGLALDMVLSYVDSAYTFTGSMSSAYWLGRTIIQYLSVFCLFGVVIWSIVNAKASAYGAQ